MASVQAKMMIFFMRKLKSQAMKFLDDLQRVRQEKERIFGRFQPPRTVKIKSIELAGMEAALHIPAEVKYADKIILYVHGGGYAAGSIKSHRGLIAKLANDCKIKAVAFNYRLAPEFPFPAAQDDAVRAYEWLIEHEGYDPKDIIMMGDSAGGGLATTTLLRLRDEGKALPLGAVLLSPWGDLSVTGESAIVNPEKDPLFSVDKVREWGAWYTGEEDVQHPYISPVNAAFHDLPPILIQVGTEEILLSDSVRMAQKAQQTNTEITLDIWDKMPHVWQMGWHYIPESKQAISKIAEYVDNLVNRKSTTTALSTYQEEGETVQQGISETAWAFAQASIETVKLGTEILKDRFK